MSIWKEQENNISRGRAIYMYEKKIRCFLWIMKQIWVQACIQDVEHKIVYVEMMLSLLWLMTVTWGSQDLFFWDHLVLCSRHKLYCDVYSLSAYSTVKAVTLDPQPPPSALCIVPSLSISGDTVDSRALSLSLSHLAILIGRQEHPRSPSHLVRGQPSCLAPAPAAIGKQAHPSIPHSWT